MSLKRKQAIEDSDASTLDLRTDFETPSKRPLKSILKTGSAIKTPLSAPLSVEMSSLELRPVFQRVTNVSPVHEPAVDDSEKSAVDLSTVCFCSPAERDFNQTKSPPKSVRRKSSTRTNSLKKTQVGQNKVTARKIKQVPFVYSDAEAFDFNAYIQSQSDSMKCTQEIDLFGMPVPISTCVKQLKPEKKIKKRTPRKTPIKIKKKQIPKKFVVRTNDNLDVSGIQVLPDSPTSNPNEKSATNIKSKPTIGINDLKILPESLTAAQDKKCINKLIDVKCDPKLDVSGEQNLSTSNPNEKSATNIKSKPTSGISDLKIVPESLTAVKDKTFINELINVKSDPKLDASGQQNPSTSKPNKKSATKIKFKYDPDNDMCGVDYLISKSSFLEEANSDKELEIFEGIVVFVDYREGSVNYSSNVCWKLGRLGVKLENKFTDKVTHVIFNDGYRRTYTTAIKRNVPLVNLLWIVYSSWAERLLDFTKFPALNMEKYINPPKRKKYGNYSKINKKIYSLITLEDFQRAEFPENENRGKNDLIRKENEEAKLKVELLSDILHKSLSVDKGHEVKHESISDRPIPIKILRKWLTPRGLKHVNLISLNDKIIKYENYFNLSSVERKRFRKHLYPAEKFLNNVKNMKLDYDTIDVQSIACTGLSNGEIDIIKNYVQNLGKYVFHTEVTRTTTFLVTKSQPNRTLNMVFAMAFGCFIISEEWVLKSHEIGKWLPYQEYLISDLSEAVKEFQTRRQEAGTWLTFPIFGDDDRIYVSNTCELRKLIPYERLKELIEACGGQCELCEQFCSVIVGHTPQMNNNISEKWILDCISEGKLLDKNQYRLDDNNMT